MLKMYYLLAVEIKNYNVIIDGRNFFDQAVKNNIRIYDNIRKVTTGQGDDYTTGYLLEFGILEFCLIFLGTLT